MTSVKVVVSGLGVPPALYSAVSASLRAASSAPTASMSTPPFFACAKIGVVYSPINWRFALAEIEYVLGDSDCRILLCDAEYAAAIAAMRQQGSTAGVQVIIGFGRDHGFADDYETLLARFSKNLPGWPAGPWS